jgi:DNA processing protein
MTSDVDLVALSLLPLWRWRGIAAQLSAGDQPHDILEQQCAEPVRAGRRRADVHTLHARAAAALDAARRSGILALVRTSIHYPPLLSAIVDPPLVLWIRGVPIPFDRPMVAIVGSRAGSPYALAVAERLGFDLAARGVVVVSGMARGVDAAAHRGALAAGGPTIAVLGSGVDVVYPPEHGALADAIAGAGAVISELVPGTPPRAPFFPHRNRIISGLSRGIVIVEAGEKSGSLITARCGLEQGRDVLAVPGNVLNTRNRGGHALLRDGARLVETADDVLEELGIAHDDAAARAPKNPSAAADTLQQPRARDPLLECLTRGEPSDLDDLSERSGLSPARLLPRLLDLELRGFVRRAGGGRFVRVDSSC